MPYASKEHSYIEQQLRPECNASLARPIRCKANSLAKEWTYPIVGSQFAGILIDRWVGSRAEVRKEIATEPGRIGRQWTEDILLDHRSRYGRGFIEHTVVLSSTAPTVRIDLVGNVAHHRFEFIECRKRIFGRQVACEHRYRGC